MLWDFQQKAVKLALKKAGFGLFMPMGSGKTMTALRIIEKRHERGQVDKACLIVPLHIVEQWQEVIRRWLPAAHLTDNPLEPANGRLLIFVCHYDWARAKPQLKVLRKAGFDLILCDEGHKLKSRDSHQSRRLWLISRTAMYRLLLTGTPVEGNELDMWAQVRFIDEKVFGAWTEFRDIWTRGSGFMGKKRKLKSHLRKPYLNKIADVSFLVESKDVLNLPPCVEETIPLRMTGQQLRAYRQMEDSMGTFIDGRRSSAELVVTQLIRLQQITGGFVTDEEQEYQFFNSIKAERLHETLEQHQKPVLVFARFLPEVEQIIQVANKLKRKVLLHTGQYKLHSSDHKKADVVIAQISTLAGLDGLQHYVSTGIFYSKTFSRIEYEQAVTRLPRPGQERKVHHMHFSCMSSIDTDLDAALSSKGDVIENVVKHLKQRTRAR